MNNNSFLSTRTVAACLGQMQMTQQQAQTVSEYFQLNAQECLWLQIIPYKNTLNGTIPSDPLLYRLHEVIQSEDEKKKKPYLLCSFNYSFIDIFRIFGKFLTGVRCIWTGIKRDNSRRIW